MVIDAHYVTHLLPAGLLRTVPRCCRLGYVAVTFTRTRLRAPRARYARCRSVTDRTHIWLDPFTDTFGDAFTDTHVYTAFCLWTRGSGHTQFGYAAPDYVYFHAVTLVTDCGYRTRLRGYYTLPTRCLFWTVTVTFPVPRFRYAGCGLLHAHGFPHIHTHTHFILVTVWLRWFSDIAAVLRGLRDALTRGLHTVRTHGYRLHTVTHRTFVYTHSYARTDTHGWLFTLRFTRACRAVGLCHIPVPVQHVYGLRVYTVVAVTRYAVYAPVDLITLRLPRLFTLLDARYRLRLPSHFEHTLVTFFTAILLSYERYSTDTHARLRFPVTRTLVTLLRLLQLRALHAVAATHVHARFCGYFTHGWFAHTHTLDGLVGWVTFTTRLACPFVTRLDVPVYYGLFYVVVQLHYATRLRHTPVT